MSEEPPMNRGWERSVPPPDLWGGERGWRLNQSPMAIELINHACCHHTSIKTQRGGVWGASPCHCAHTPNSMGTAAPPLGTRPYASLHLTIDSYPVIFFVINWKSGEQAGFLSSVGHCSTLMEPQEEIVDTRFIASWSEEQGQPGLHEWRLTWRAALWA